MTTLEQKIEAARSVNGIPFSDYDSAWSSVGELLVARCTEDRTLPWLVYYDGNGEREEWSRGAFLDGVYRVARYLRSRGVGKGDRIAVLGHNHVQTVIQYFAAWLLGTTVVPLNPGEDDERILYILENSGASLLFLRTDYAERWYGMADRLPAVQTVVLCRDDQDYDGESSDRDQSWMEEILASGDPTPVIPRIHLLDHEALIVYTSGTTGNPKGVLLTHGNLLADAEGIASWHGIDATTRMMCVLPIHHVNGTVVTLMTPLVAGGSVVLNRKFQSSTFFPRLAREGVSVVSVVPTLLAYLVSADIDTSEYDLAKFRHIICGAGPLTCELAIRFEQRYELPIIHGYGLSETTCYSCFLPTELSREERRAWLSDHGFPSIGPPIPQNEMAIHDERGNPLSAGERGEIVIRGHNVMSGYYNNPAANETTFEHGWFRSGDEGFYLESEDGKPFFFITGRLKELIIRGGVNLSPLEIDEVLNSHTGIDAAIAVGFENSWYGEEIGAVVRRSDPELTESEVIAFCAEHLPFARRPKVVVFSDDIPVTSTGKYQRNRVRHLFTDHRETQFREEQPDRSSGT